MWSQFKSTFNLNVRKKAAVLTTTKNNKQIKKKQKYLRTYTN